MRNEAPKQIPEYRRVLQQELETRSGRNPRYSLRSFARDLNMTPQRLSDLIRGRYGLSETQASHLATQLDLSGHEQKKFVLSAAALHARSPKRRKAAEMELLHHELTQKDENITSISLDSFQIISEWYHYAILELTYVNGFQSNPAWIAKQLGLTSFVVEKAIDRLLRLDFLKTDENGKWTCCEEFVATPSGIPSDALKKFHKQVLEKASEALSLQSVRERDFASVVMAINPDQLDEAKEDLKQFRRAFSKKYGSGPNQKEVYCLGTQFFRLQQKSEDV